MSWTVDFVREWLPRMTAVSVLRFWWHERKWKCPPNSTLALEFRRPLTGRILLRRHGSDFDTLLEIAKFEVYKCVIDEVPDARTIIDLGANVGLASLYFARAYPDCRILALEPHPETF